MLTGVFVVVVGAVLAVVFAGGDEPVGGTAVAVQPPRTVPAAPQDGWTTLSNPASGLSYQIPPTDWSTSPQD
ncbi:MAG TPA: hypothetical protein VJX10_20910, partial [Pseudonocardiaceae bacterium]|nr:hypothetical protein [Pseudonocardiaceae bacterium]